ncbi:MAG: Plasmid stabilization system protein [Limisphaerales bacterium]|nr:MAG: Plasmid stabilization system protein [Limisphaerales bacterium]KAG0509469.1 MAG: Plasmid stabilization system protein [Limisphaerales bacterium]TXT52306.1 MAG: Plasmid stabilization system protein [Limisphaerales bacterium]
MKPHVFHPAAEEEYTEAARYYGGFEAELGGRFYDEMERLIREVRSQPMRFWMFDPPVRRHLSTVFPYAVVYLEQPDRIWIVAVMHCKRKPGYWRERLE